MMTKLREIAHPSLGPTDDNIVQLEDKNTIQTPTTEHCKQTSPCDKSRQHVIKPFFCTRTY